VKEKRIKFEIDGKRIPAALVEPEKEAPKWCVVLIAGSGPADIDGNYPDGGMWPGRTNVLLDFARHFAGRGVACFRYSRADMETVDQQKAIAFKRFDHRVVVAAEACRIARELVPSACLAVAGHSEGSVVGSMLCAMKAEACIGAFISLSGPAYRFYDLMLQGAERRSVGDVMQLGPIKMSLNLYRKAIGVARYGTPVPPELDALPFGFHKMDPDSLEYLRGYDAVDNSEVIARASCPVLIVQGGADESVWFENGERLFEARRHSSTATSVAFFKELDHFYKPGKNTEMDPAVVASIVDWLRGL
jgi:fermentation-respiration switch protein FrsA (DUF1100 family)